MLHSLALPKYDKVKDYEGTGNFAVSKYYKFPWRIFYRHKLKMIVSHFDKKLYRNILDFGSGKAEIFREELQKHALQVKCIELQDEINASWKFDVVVCASVLEFTHLPVCLSTLKRVVHPNGMLVVSSPMDTWLSRLYFKFIGDKNSRHSHKEILSESSKYFFILDYQEWFGLYFSFKGYPKV